MLFSRCGIRQGCVLGIFIFCITMDPIYTSLKNELGPEGMLLTYSDDAYLHGPPMSVASAITTAPLLYKKVGLRIDWGSEKSELVLPPDVDPEALCLSRGEDGVILPHLV